MLSPLLGIQTIPARRGVATFVPAGYAIKIHNTSGHQVVDTWCFSLRQGPSFTHSLGYTPAAQGAAAAPEFMSMSHSRASMLKLVPAVGDALVSQKRRKLLTVVTDTSPGVHDTLISACDRWRYEELGVQGYHESCTDNCWDAIEALAVSCQSHADGQKEAEWLRGLCAGLGGRLPDPLNLFMNIPVAAKEGNGQMMGLSFEAPVGKEREWISLRAEVDCVVVMSACPQDVLKTNGEGPVDGHFEVIKDSQSVL